MNIEDRKLLAIALKKQKQRKLRECFDPRHEDSRPTALQQEVFDDIEEYPARFVVAANQTGKSQLGGRECAWIFSETHPTWKRPEAWGDAPLTMLIIGRTSTIVEEELWNKKVKPFLSSDEYRTTGAGGILSKAVHTNGNTILFFSHHAPEEARAKLQAFTAHWVWLDEMPNSYRLLEELETRTIANAGYLLATFTPKLKNNEIRRKIDTPGKYHKRYKFAMLDNPIFSERKDVIMAKYASLPEAYRRTVMEGDWYIGDTAVYQFSEELHAATPPAYSPAWRHVESVDPAASGKCGTIILAEDPATAVWYVVRADYTKGSGPTDLLKHFAQQYRGLNIVQRICDPHETWFIKEAWSARQLTYVPIYNKKERKKELIKNLQEALLDGRIKVAPWCTELINEFTTCQWSETVNDKIVGASRFHLLDAMQYAIDDLPRSEVEFQPLSYRQWMKQSHAKSKLVEASKLRGTGRLIGRRRWG